MQSSDDGRAGVSVDQSRLIALLKRGIRAVNGRDLTALAAPDLPPGPLDLIAVGKAACAMAQGLLDIRARTVRRGLVVTRHGYATPLQTPHGVDVEVRTAGHPIPDATTLQAGDALLRFVTSGDPDTTLIFLLSGGASALVERPLPGMTASDLAQINRWLLASGKPITEINAVRCALSTLKGGRLAARLPYRRTFYWLLSDVVGDDPATIGSGLLAAARPARLPDQLPEALQRWAAKAEPIPSAVHRCFRTISTRILAGNRTALNAIGAAARDQKLTVHPIFPPVTGNAQSAGETMGDTLCAGSPGLYLWGGEPTVTLPPDPGRGGRCRHLALAAAASLAGGAPTWLLAAGSDGEDGGNGAAGGWVSHATAADIRALGCSADDFLQRADSGSLLAALGQEVVTGPTDTNVMDIILGYRGPVGPV